MHLTNDDNGRIPEPDRPAMTSVSSVQDEIPDIDAMLDCGVAALRASGRLLFEDDELDRALVRVILDAVFPIS